MNKIDVIIDALSVAQNSVWSTLNQEALAYAIELKVELAKPEERVCCGGYEKCWKACTPRGRWLAEKELRKEWNGLTEDDMHTIRGDAFNKNVDDMTWAVMMARKINFILRGRNT